MDKQTFVHLERHALAVEDVLRAARPAWLDAGDREDWAGRIGVLRTIHRSHTRPAR